MKSSTIILQCALTSFCFSAAFVRSYNRYNSPSSVCKRNLNPVSMISNRYCTGEPFFSRKRPASAASIDDIVSETTEHATRYSLDSLMSFVKVLWDFTRPHTIVGSGISVVALYTYGTPPHLWGTQKFFSSLGSCLLPALLMNIYITGLNQVTDVDIDRINKPYLPIAAGNLSKEHGILVVIASLISSLYLIRNVAWPLQAVVTGSCILGTLYSMPPFRLKRYPLLAAFCILIVRGTLVNMGFFLQAKVQVLGESIPSVMSACRMFPESVLLTVYFAIFGVVIALMKDVPDVKGDKMNSISSFSVKLGAAKMFRTAWQLLVGLLLSTAASIVGTLFIPQLKAVTPAITKTVLTCRILLASILSLFAFDVTKRAEEVDISKPDRIFSYYMHVWNIFYASYFLLPLVR